MKSVDLLVTTHTGGVDWNLVLRQLLAQLLQVTTHTGGVDWNKVVVYYWVYLICHHPHGWCGLKFSKICPEILTNIVTTHTGGVDWNCLYHNIPTRESVTTHTGGVDWNAWRWGNCRLWTSHHPHGWCGLKFGKIRKKSNDIKGHHPHGWCGLKSELKVDFCCSFLVTTHTGGVDWNIDGQCVVGKIATSPPTRVVWIEILQN